MTGRVQGVGFRPFVYRLAHEHALDGHVRNLRGDVEVVVAGGAAAVEAFARGLVERAPPLARPGSATSPAATCRSGRGFEIAPSSTADAPQVSVPPDFFACDDCVAELADPADRRYGYPFINCTQCGPRYTLIEALPYDRPNTSMAGFPLCAACRREYQDPLDRRFHAEPVACPVCGPHLSFVEPGRTPVTGDGAAVAAAVDVLRAGRVLAVRGIGGYHLLCDACDEVAVRRLRERKRRPDKPLAVMFPQRGEDGLDAARRELEIGSVEQEALVDPTRPIVLVRQRAGGQLARRGARLAEIGAFLPYSPLHHLLLAAFGGPVVATSGNVSGEPVLTDPAEAGTRLASVADAFLHHDRPIVRPADDSVVRITAGQARPIRLGRGLAPLELELPDPLPEPLVAVGGHLKLTVALAWDRRIVVSPHIGDMGTLRSEQVFGQVVRDLQRLYDVEARHWLCDAHPGYTTTRWVQAQGQPYSTVLHHHAHASGLVMEHGCLEPAIVFAWDGVGYGGDGSLWGGETFVGRPVPGSDARACAASGCRAATRPDARPGAAQPPCAGKRASSARCRSRPDRARGLGAGRQFAAFERGGPRLRRAGRDRARHRRDQLRGPGTDVPRGLRPAGHRVPVVADRGGCGTPAANRLGAAARNLQRPPAQPGGPCRRGPCGAGRCDLPGGRSRALALRRERRRAHRRRVPEPPAGRAGRGSPRAKRLPGVAAGANSVQRRRSELRTGRRLPGTDGRRGRDLTGNRCERYGYTATMLWFERPFLHVLRREYAGAMRFDEDDAAEVMPAAPAAPCQLYVHVPFCEVLCPFCSFHRVRYNESKTARYFAALRQEIRLYHDAASASATSTWAAARRP